jgi:hypothetical protein
MVALTTEGIAANTLAKDAASDLDGTETFRIIQSGVTKRTTAANILEYVELRISGDATDHIADTDDAHDASAISFSPTGAVAATNVQTAIAELDTDKLAASSYTAADVLTKLLTVDGAGSGLDADLLDGNSSAFFSPATVSGTAAAILASLLTVDGAGSGLDADLLDGKTTGTSGNTIPLLDGTNTWSALNVFSMSGSAMRFINSNDTASVRALRIEGDRATPTDNDNVHAAWMLSDDGGTQIEVGRATAVATDVSAGTVDGIFTISVMDAGVLTTAITIDDDGVDASKYFAGGVTTSTAGSNWVETLREFSTSIAQSAVVSTIGQIALTTASRTSDHDVVDSQGTIGLEAIVNNDNAGELMGAFGSYLEVHRQATCGTAIGMEIDIVNMGSLQTITPYTNISVGGGYTPALWVASGGGDVVGATTASIAIGILDNNASFEKGIIFIDGAMTVRADGLYEAIGMPVNYALSWWDSGAAINANIYSSATDASLNIAFENGKISFETIAQAEQASIDTSGIITGNSLKVGAAPVGALSVHSSSVNFNSGTTDTAVTIVLPSGYTRWRILSINISGASASITTATAGAFTTAGGAGTTIAADQSLTVSTASENTANNCMSLTTTGTNTQSYNDTSVFFRIGTPQGSAATANVTFTYVPLP